MSDLRKAAEMALEALDAYSWEQVDAAAKALRQALAMEKFSEVNQEIEEALAQPLTRVGEMEWQWGYERGWDKAMETRLTWSGLSVSQSLDLIREYEDRPLELLEAAESILREKNT